MEVHIVVASRNNCVDYASKLNLDWYQRAQTQAPERHKQSSTQKTYKTNKTSTPFHCHLVKKISNVLMTTSPFV